MKEKTKTINVSAPPSDQDLTTSVKVRIHPTEEQIRQRAYEIHKARGGNSHPLIAWLQADNELKAEMSRQQSDNTTEMKRSSARS